MYDTIHTPDYFSDLQYLTNGAAQGAAGDVPLPGLAQLLLFTLSIHGNTRPAQYGIAYKKVNVFCHLSLLLKSLQASASVVWLKHQHMRVKNI
jgi:hypothetical protein